jgi:hypothetical protein
MRSWHDYHLTGYLVEGTAHRISLDVCWPYGTDTDVRRAHVVFSEVEGYFFEHDLGGNILFSIEEEQVESFLRYHAEKFQHESKWGWPLFWQGDVGSTQRYMMNRSLKPFDISTSYGLSGWVVAESVESYAIAP